jgi:hypothetical protein
VLARYESGETAPVRLEDGIGALAQNSRYSPALDRSIEPMKPNDAEFCQKFLTAQATVYNRKAPPGRKIEAYELQVWTWDFHSNPGDTIYGNRTKRLTFDINEASTAGEKNSWDGLSSARVPH